MVWENKTFIFPTHVKEEDKDTSICEWFVGHGSFMSAVTVKKENRILAYDLDLLGTAQMTCWNRTGIVLPYVMLFGFNSPVLMLDRCIIFSKC